MWPMSTIRQFDHASLRGKTRDPAYLLQRSILVLITLKCQNRTINRAKYVTY